ncbi:putative mitochondrial protein, partial [Mucuna pruriens]
MRSIQEIYDETKIINDLFCLFVDSEPLTFDEAIEDKSSLKLSKFDSGEKEDPTLFKSLVGSLMYLTSTRPDIMYAIGVVCCFMRTSTSTHMKATKRILRYLKGTFDFGLFYSSSNEFKL